MNVTSNVNQPGIIQLLYDTINENFEENYELIRTTVVSGVEFCQNHIICAIAVVAVTNVVFTEISILALTYLQNTLKVYDIYDMPKEDRDRVLFVALVVLNAGLCLYCPLMHPILQTTIGLSSSIGYFVMTGK